jgi:hypothetical protein
MYNIQDITSIHLELTSKCQARCPMCPRRINGGIINPLITLDEETLRKNRSDFIIFVDEHDRRRGTNFLKTFPEIEQAYHKWSKL